MNKFLLVAQTIASARLSRTPLQAFTADAAPQTEADGYAIQDELHNLLAPEFGPLVGYKIGCTSAVMQRYISIPHPCSGGVFAKGVHHSGASLRHSHYVRVGIECEIAVRLARDLAPADVPFTADSVADAIESYLPAIEIVDDRYADWRSAGAPTLVADDFFAAGCVLGTPVARSAAPDLLAVVGRALINGEAPAPTCSVIRTTRWHGSPTISPRPARRSAPVRSCSPEVWCRRCGSAPATRP
jgi:2-keto-4-pentenoate hydratase